MIDQRYFTPVQPDPSVPASIDITPRPGQPAPKGSFGRIEQQTDPGMIEWTMPANRLDQEAAAKQQAAQPQARPRGYDPFAPVPLEYTTNARNMNPNATAMEINRQAVKDFMDINRPGQTNEDKDRRLAAFRSAAAERVRFNQAKIEADKNRDMVLRQEAMQRAATLANTALGKIGDWWIGRGKNKADMEIAAMNRDATIQSSQIEADAATGRTKIEADAAMNVAGMENETKRDIALLSGGPDGQYNDQELEAIDKRRSELLRRHDQNPESMPPKIRQLYDRYDAILKGGQGGGAAVDVAKIPPGAVKMLKGDPSPEARQEFDAAYGPGAADLVLGG